MAVLLIKERQNTPSRVSVMKDKKKAYGGIKSMRAITNKQKDQKERMVFIDDETYILLEEIKKGMFKCYADIQEFLNVNESVINHEEFERIYMRSCVEAFEKDPNMI